MSGLPLSYLVNELSGISEIGKIIAGGRDWDNPIQISDTTFRILKEKLDFLKSADWRMRSSCPETFDEIVFIAAMPAI